MLKKAMGGFSKASGDAGHVEGKLLKLSGRCQGSKHAPHSMGVHARGADGDGTACTWQAERVKHLLWVSV